MVVVRSQSKQYLIFRLGDYYFGSVIDSIKRILTIDKVYKVPLAKTNFEGIVDFEGKPLPLFNLGEAMELNRIQPDGGLVAVQQIAGKDVGVMIGDVLAVARFDPETIEDYSGQMPFVEKMIVWEGKEVKLINSEKLL